QCRRFGGVSGASPADTGASRPPTPEPPTDPAQREPPTRVARPGNGPHGQRSRESRRGGRPSEKTTPPHNGPTATTRARPGQTSAPRTFRATNGGPTARGPPGG